MPGFDISRFTEPNPEIELRDMVCPLCHSIFRKPLVTVCCSATYCESCLKSWLHSKRTCPADAKPLKMEQLLQPPAIVFKMLNRKKIRCVFKAKGCSEILTVENVESHEMSCMFGKNLCQKCGCVVASTGKQHDCLKALLDFKQSISGQIDTMRKQIDNARIESKNLRGQIDSHTKTIKELVLDRIQIEAKPVVTCHVTSNKELLTEARKHVTSPVVNPHKTPKEIVDKAVEAMKDAILNKGDKIYDTTRAVKEFMDAHFIGDWNVYVVYNNVGFVFHNIIAEGFIEIKLGKALFTIYKTFDMLFKITFSRLASFIKAGILRDFVVANTGYEEAATYEIKKIILACLKTCQEMNEFTDKVSAQLIGKYGGVWHCFFYKTNSGFYCVRSDKGRFCLLSNADVKILVFQ